MTPFSFRTSSPTPSLICRTCCTFLKLSTPKNIWVPSWKSTISATQLLATPAICLPSPAMSRKPTCQSICQASLSESRELRNGFQSLIRRCFPTKGWTVRMSKNKRKKIAITMSAGYFVTQPKPATKSRSFFCNHACTREKATLNSWFRVPLSFFCNNTTRKPSCWETLSYSKLFQC